MLDWLSFVVFPYVAITLCVVGSVVRYRLWPYSYSSLSTQFLEDRLGRWGAAPWHLGILIVLAGHLLTLCGMTVMPALTARHATLLVVEGLALACGLMAFYGLLVLTARRMTVARVRAVTGAMDGLVLALLLAQVALGIAVAIGYRWGAVWATGNLTPYVQGLLTLSPRPDLVADLPPVIKAHVLIAFAIILILPFTQLVHMLAAPVAFLWRRAQVVVWNSRPRR